MNRRKNKKWIRLARCIYFNGNVCHIKDRKDFGEDWSDILNAMNKLIKEGHFIDKEKPDGWTTLVAQPTKFILVACKIKL